MSSKQFRISLFSDQTQLQFSQARVRVRIPFRPEFLSGFHLTAALSCVYNCDDQS